jgi:uncharacterized damage-inducible protein DinB
MNTSDALAGLGRRYAFNERVLAAASEGFSDADWARAPGPHGGNCAHWLLAHLVRTRRELLRALGEEAAREAWEGGYGRGSASVLHAETPAPAALAGEFARQGARLAERLATLSPEHADRPFLYPLPDGGRSLADGAHFLYFHETYHLGQIGLLRRIAGKAGFI